MKESWGGGRKFGLAGSGMDLKLQGLYSGYTLTSPVCPNPWLKGGPEESPRERDTAENTGFGLIGKNTCLECILNPKPGLAYGAETLPIICVPLSPACLVHHEGLVRVCWIKPRQEKAVFGVWLYIKGYEYLQKDCHHIISRYHKGHKTYKVLKIWE